MKINTKAKFSRFGYAGAYLALFLILLGIGFILYWYAAHTVPSSSADSGQIYENFLLSEKKKSDSYYYNLIGELVYEALYEELTEEEIYQNLSMFGYTNKEITNAVSELGLDWNSRTITNTDSRYFKELVETGTISESGQVP